MSQPALTALVTGAAAGLGRAAAIRLAEAGYQLILVDRDTAGLATAAAQIDQQMGVGTARPRTVDLASLAQIAAACDSIVAEFPSLDLMLGNAGILPPRQLSLTEDGFELGFGISVVGHYALLVGLAPLWQASAAPRLVMTSSIAHRAGRIMLDHRSLPAVYDASQAYADAKLGALLLARALQEQARQAGSPLLSLAAHPGISATGIGDGWRRETAQRMRDRIATWLMAFAFRYLGQPPDRGCEALVLAATDPAAPPAAYYGPGGWFHWRGTPQRQQAHPRGRDDQQAQALLQVLSQWTGLTMPWSGHD